MKNKPLLILFLLIGCTTETTSEKAQEVYKKIHNRPDIAIWRRESAFIRGDRYYVFLDSINVAFVEDGGIIYSKKPLLPNQKDRVKSLVSFMKENHLLSLRGDSLATGTFLELRLDGSTILVKSSNKEYYTQLLRTEKHVQKIDSSWFFYEQPLK